MRRGAIKILSVFLGLAAAVGWGQGPARLESRWSPRDFELTADPEAPAWKGIAGAAAATDSMGRAVAGPHRTEIRSRWTESNLYFLFICEYDQLYLKPGGASTGEETNKLWDWDVAEAFIGADFERIHQYKEFQVSPRGEWVDLDINRERPQPEGGWRWNSGFTVKARLDEAKKVWYGEMRIPLASLGPRKGNELRANFYRLQGPGPRRTMIAWRPTGKMTYHVPEAFGRLALVK